METIELFGNVGTDITVDSVCNFINQNKDKELQFDISTLGGDLDTGLTIHNLIKQHPKKTTAKIVGLTASAGTIIGLGCDEVIMGDNALFLIHNGWREVTGNVYDFQKAASDMMKTDALMVKIYKEKSGLPEDKIINLMKASDWMLPYEALEFGFIDRIEKSGVKIAASAIITTAQGKVNNLLLTKLEEKMKIFGKEKNEKRFPLTLADGNICVINAETVAPNVEIAPLGAMTLEDGEYQLADGRKISVAGGMITEVTEQTPEPETNTELIGAVAEMIAKMEEKIEASIDEKIKPLQALASNHKPAKGGGPVNPSQASFIDNLQAKVEAKKAELAEAAAKKRKGV